MVAEAQRRSLGLEITDIRNKQPLAQHELAAGQILVPRARLFPPRLRALVMLTPRPHHHARLVIGGPRLHGVAVEDDAVHALGKRVIADGLEKGRMKPPPFLIVGCEGLGTDDASAINVSRRRHAGAGFHAIASRRPKFAHRFFRLTTQWNGIARAAIGLQRETHSGSIGQLPETPGVIFDHHVGNRPAHIPKKALRDFEAVHDASGEHRKERHQIVSAPLLKFLPHPRGPVLRPVLPTVNVGGHQAIGRWVRRDARVACELGHHAREMRIDPGLTELVTLEAPTGLWRGRVFRSGARMADSQDRPLAGRHVPDQAPVRIHLRGERDDVLRADDGLRCEFALAALMPGHGVVDAADDIRGRLAQSAVLERCLRLDAGNPEIARCWKCLHSDVAIKTGDGRRLRQDAFKAVRSGDMGFAPCHFLHRLLGLDPRPAAAVPTGVVVHVDFEAQAFCLGVNVPERIAPRISHEIHRTDRRALIHLHDQCAAEPDPPHRFQIRCDAAVRDVAIEPEPINPWPRLVRRVLKSGIKPGRRSCGQQRQCEEDRQEDFFHWYFFGFTPVHPAFLLPPG